MEENATYKYLLSLKYDEEQEQETISILKGKDSIKGYLIEAIKSYESGEKECKEKEIEGIQNFKKDLKSFQQDIDNMKMMLRGLDSKFDAIQEWMKSIY